MALGLDLAKGARGFPWAGCQKCCLHCLELHAVHRRSDIQFQLIFHHSEGNGDLYQGGGTQGMLELRHRQRNLYLRIFWFRERVFTYAVQLASETSGQG